jgi:threonine dehydrogenase-like Zn-dependent dehydrogenase
MPTWWMRTLCAAHRVRNSSRGSDLWYYRGDSPFEPGPIGHEFVGVVEDVGSEVHNVAKGDFVIAPFAYSDGTCPHCRHGITSASTPVASSTTRRTSTASQTRTLRWTSGVRSSRFCG